MIREALEKVSGDRLRRDLFYLSSDPLKYRKVNYTRPGSSKRCTRRFFNGCMTALA